MQEANFSTFPIAGSWVILSDIEKRIREKIELIGIPLKDNEAFIIDAHKKDELICADPKSAEIIRPILRGRDIKPYGYEYADQWLIALFPAKNYDIENFPAVKRHLLTFGKTLLINAGYDWLAENYLEDWCYQRLEQTGKEIIVNGKIITVPKNERSRKATNNKWFETQDSISYWDDFYRQKIVWGEISDKSNFALDKHDKYFVNNKCYLLTGNRLEYLVCFLNSHLSEYLFSKIATTTGVGTAQWSKFTIEQLRIPLVTEEQNTDFTFLLSELKANKITEDDVNRQIYEMCNLSLEEVAFIETRAS